MATSLRANYEKIMFDMEVKKWLIESGKYVGEHKKGIDDLIAKHKRECRQEVKEKYSPKYLYYGKDGEGYGEIINSGGDWDYFWKKVIFPGEHWKEEEKEQFRQENWKRARYCAYDCTGDVFTWAIDVFNTPNGVVAYIREAVDC